MSSVDKRLIEIRNLADALYTRSDKLEKQADRIGKELASVDRLAKALEAERKALVASKAEENAPLVVFKLIPNDVEYRVVGTYHPGDTYIQIKRAGPGFNPIRYPVSDIDVYATFKKD